MSKSNLKKIEILKMFNNISVVCGTVSADLDGISKRLDEMERKNNFIRKWSLSSSAFCKLKTEFKRGEKIVMWNKADDSIDYIKSLIETSQKTGGIIYYRNHKQKLIPVLLDLDDLELVIYFIDKTHKTSRLSITETDLIIKSIIIK